MIDKVMEHFSKVVMGAFTLAILAMVLVALAWLLSLMDIVVTSYVITGLAVCWLVGHWMLKESN